MPFEIYKSWKTCQDFLVFSFWVFHSGTYTETKNKETLVIFSRLVNLKETVLFDEVQNFSFLCDFDFHPYTEVE